MSTKKFVDTRLFKYSPLNTLQENIEVAKQAVLDYELPYTIEAVEDYIITVPILVYPKRFRKEDVRYEQTPKGFSAFIPNQYNLDKPSELVLNTDFYPTGIIAGLEGAEIPINTEDFDDVTHIFLVVSAGPDGAQYNSGDVVCIRNGAKPNVDFIKEMRYVIWRKEVVKFKLNFK